MKKNIILIFFLFYLLTGSSFAQNDAEDWFPVGAQWIYVKRGLGIPESQCLMEVMRDIITENQACRIIDFITPGCTFPGAIFEPCSHEF